MQKKPNPPRTPGGQPRRLADVLERKTRAAQQMRRAHDVKRLPGHGHRVHGR
jgi:hypothetical protein